MFDSVANAYDRTNSLLSFGQDHYWRWRLKRQIAAKPGERILDVAAGTGTSSAALLSTGVTVVASDFSEGMLAVGRTRHPELEFVFADAMKLPFKDASFDVVTISFGLRNVQDPTVALAEMLRVLRPGGRIAICEFSKVTLPLASCGYNFYLKRLLPGFSRLFSKAPEAYSYLSDSIAAWPNQEELAEMIRKAGFSSVAWKNLSLGVVAIHTGQKASH